MNLAQKLYFSFLFFILGLVLFYCLLDILYYFDYIINDIEAFYVNWSITEVGEVRYKSINYVIPIRFVSDSEICNYTVLLKFVKLTIVSILFSYSLFNLIKRRNRRN